MSSNPPQGDPKQRAETSRNTATALIALATAVLGGLLAALVALAPSLSHAAAIWSVSGVVLAIAATTYSLYAGLRGNTVVGQKLASGAPITGSYDDGWYNRQAVSGLFGVVVGVAAIALPAAFGLEDGNVELTALAKDVGRISGRLDDIDRALSESHEAIEQLKAGSDSLSKDFDGLRREASAERSKASEAIVNVNERILNLQNISDKLTNTLAEIQRSLNAQKPAGVQPPEESPAR
jgi:hypothetical protein